MRASNQSISQMQDEFRAQSKQKSKQKANTTLMEGKQRVVKYPINLFGSWIWVEWLRSHQMQIALRFFCVVLLSHFFLVLALCFFACVHGRALEQRSLCVLCFVCVFVCVLSHLLLLCYPMFCWWLTCHLFNFAFDGSLILLFFMIVAQNVKSPQK